MPLKTLATTLLTLCAPYHDAQLDRYGYVLCDESGRTPPHYHMAEAFGPGGIAAVLDDSGWYYIDRHGNEVIRPMIYDNGPDYFSQGLARYQEKGKYGYFDRHGRMVIPARYDYATPFTNGHARVGTDCTAKTEGEHTRMHCRQWNEIPLPPPLSPPAP